ncbi:hypothetical protein LCGC14_1546060 [marine sediment metagenome]|uniref:Uncharacterized protein n=1 Tax=marine sediment metagenome TaxID=412755 RepID=A0A0F9L7S7_9ZZZZ
MIDPERDEITLKTFKKQKVMTVSQLADLLHSSVPTVHNRLRIWQAYTSYNKNGRYYTLPTIPKFDGHGLWKYKGSFFSKHGNLKKTVIQLVKSSPMGLEGSEIGRLLDLTPRSFMSHFRKMDGLCRERFEGRFIYFSDEEAVLLNQKQRLKKALEKRRATVPSATDAVLVLAELIKHPGSNSEDCSERLKRRGIDIAPEAIRNLLDYHGIKKTPATS